MDTRISAMLYLGKLPLAVMVCALFGGPTEYVFAGTRNVQNALAERQVKAAYIYKFASYVEWPVAAFARSDSPLVIGVMGADMLAEELEHTVVGRTVSGRSFSVRRLSLSDSLAGVHILFIGKAAVRAQIAEMLAVAKGQPVLTITDSPEYYSSGTMINFILADNRLRFEVALRPVSYSGLKISARMLGAAYKVESGAQ